MNRFEIRDILNAHKEHFRVLPTLAQNELNGIIHAIDAEVVAAAEVAAQKAIKKPAKKKEKTPVEKFTTGKEKAKGK